MLASEFGLRELLTQPAVKRPGIDALDTGCGQSLH